MKRMNKFFMLLTMLLVSSSFKGANDANKMVVADAAASESAYLADDWKNKISMAQSINSLLITNDSSKKPTNYWISSDVDTDSSNTFITAYVGPNTIDSNKLDCVIYGDVGMIYAQNGMSLFASLSNVEKITFDCYFSMANAEDNSMFSMFADDTNLAQIEGLSNLDTTNVTNMSFMFNNCRALTSLDVSHFDTSNVTTMQSMFYYCTSLTSIDGLTKWSTYKVTDMSWMFYECISLKTLDLSGFYLFAITDNSQLENILGNLVSLTEIKAPSFLKDDLTIQLPNSFGVGVIDASKLGMTIIPGSQELNNLFTTLRNLYTCSDYMQGPALQVTYEGLSEADKAIFSTLKDYDGVLLTEKLAYMCYLAEANTTPATAEIYMAISPVASQYLVVIIACLSLALIGGYYLVQKKKYAK